MDPLDKHLPQQPDTIKEIHGELDTLLRVGLAAADNLRATVAKSKERDAHAMAAAAIAQMGRLAESSPPASLGALLAVSGPEPAPAQSPLAFPFTDPSHVSPEVVGDLTTDPTAALPVLAQEEGATGTDLDDNQGTEPAGPTQELATTSPVLAASLGPEPSVTVPNTLAELLNLSSPGGISNELAAVQAGAPVAAPSAPEAATERTDPSLWLG